MCLTKIGGFPAPNVTMHSRGTMAFARRDGTMWMRVRVTQHVGQPFLRDAITGHLDRGWQRRQMLWRLEREGDATRAILRDLLLDGHDQAEIIQGWRT